MAKNERRNKKTFIIYCLLFILIVILVVLIYNERKEYNIANKKYEDLKIILNNTNGTTNKEKNSIEEQINFYKNYDENLAKIKKEVYANTVLLENKIQSNNADIKIAYLTFDDGPYYSTYKYLDVLDKYNIKGTFFTTNINGTQCYDNKNYNCHELYSEYLKRGMTLANHTYSHSIHKGLYKTSDSFINSVKKQENLIKELTNSDYQTNIVRFPGGSSTARGLKNDIIKKLKENGYGWIDWTASDGDGSGVKSTDAAWNNFISSIDSNIEVVLFHDYSRITIQILPKAIEYLQSQNYLILPLSYDSNMINK